MKLTATITLVMLLLMGCKTNSKNSTESPIDEFDAAFLKNGPAFGLHQMQPSEIESWFSEESIQTLNEIGNWNSIGILMKIGPIEGRTDGSSKYMITVSFSEKPREFIAFLEMMDGHATITKIEQITLTKVYTEEDMKESGAQTVGEFLRSLNDEAQNK